MLPADLLKTNPPEDPEDGRPGMYCIGVMEQTFPYASKLPMIIPEGVTKTNKVSIAAMIMWDNGAGKPPRCSHYFAGDASDRPEAEFVAWLKAGDVTRVTSAKLSHHGSRSSTPLTMLETFQPSNIIISNPNGRYFHPGKLVIFQICRS